MCPENFLFLLYPLKKSCLWEILIFFIYHFRKLTSSDKGVLGGGGGRGVGVDINVGVTLPNLVFLGEISNQPLNE